MFWFWFPGHEACGMLAPQPGIEPIPPALEGEVLTTGLPGSPRSGPINTRQSRFTIGEYYRDKEDDFYIWSYRDGSSMNLEIAGSSIFRNKQPEMLTYLNLLSNVTKDIFEEITVASCLITDTLVAQAFSPA